MISKGILAGMRVIEASAFVAAPLGGMTLAQLGADVIRIDPVGGGLDHRRWPVTKDNVSLFWCGLNKSKRSVAIDLALPDGRELAMALICAPGADAGMLLTNLPPRGFLSYETLRARRPDLIQLTIQGDRYGRSAVDYTVNPRVGLPFLTGREEDDDVVNHVLPAWDLVTGHMAAVGLLTAERHRRTTHEGQHVQLALEDMALAVMGHLGFLAEAQLGKQRERVGNALFGAFGRDFVTRDGQRIMIVALTLKQWASLCRATALGPQIEEIGASLGFDFATEGDRFRGRKQIAQLVEAWVGHRSLERIRAQFEADGVCWGRYQTVTQLVQSDPACSEANPLFTTLEQPGVGRYLAPGIPLTFSAFNRMPPKAAPILGQHTEEVLADVLKLTSGQIGRLLDQRVVGKAAVKAAG